MNGQNNSCHDCHDYSDSTFQNLAHVILTQSWEVKQDYPQSQRLSALLKLLIPKHHIIS